MVLRYVLSGPSEMTKHIYIKPNDTNIDILTIRTSFLDCRLRTESQHVDLPGLLFSGVENLTKVTTKQRFQAFIKRSLLDGKFQENYTGTGVSWGTQIVIFTVSLDERGFV